VQPARSRLARALVADPDQVRSRRWPHRIGADIVTVVGLTERDA
jgi:hypothetical protein